ncbi:polysaccharide deacetylase family protein [Spiroplasma litorale]|uniref:polysaccharide deacetylase family protein n=1 Tax=Spiroplasma litorale TaxID=216942 RepID=UPI00130E9762|nr:polysaccharide deacetylase family protein [Spiroplasma litorale]
MHSNKKVCMLTFDDGPSTENDNEILNILEKYKVPGTFFYVGKNIEDNINNLKPLFNRILENGSYIGNHTFTHNKYVLKTNSLVNEINKTNELIISVSNELNNEYIPLRMPYLQFYSGIDSALSKLNQDNFIGGYLSGDWVYDKYGKEEIIKNI